MNLKEFAALLDGREYGQEMTKAEEQKAKQLGFVVVYGVSDDLAEFGGAIHDEAGCYEGRKIFLTESGLLEGCEYGSVHCKHHEAAKAKCKTIEAVWCGEGEFCWTYKTDIPHETFIIREAGELYCRGIVFDIKSLEK